MNSCLRDGTFEGTPHPNKDSAISNKSLHLIYRGHIPKIPYKIAFKNEVMGSSCKNGKVTFLEMAHETADSAVSCDHTHVVVQCTHPIRIRAKEALAWDYGGEIGEVLPTIRVLSRADEMSSAKCMLGDEDTENKQLGDKYVKYKQIPDAADMYKDFDSDPEQGCFVLEPIKAPRYKVAHLLRWQKQAYFLMKKETPRKINYIYDTTGESGKLTLLAAIKNSDNKSSLILNGLPDRARVKSISDVSLDDWTRELLIVNMRTRCELDLIPHQAVVALLNTATSMGCHSVWILSNSMPNRLDCLAKERWNIYRICCARPRGEMSDLEVVSYADAHLLLSQ